MRDIRRSVVAILLALSAGCAHLEHRLVRLKAEVMTADYRADRPALLRLRDELLPLAGSPGIGYLAHYWSGYASWRIAINGVNQKMSAADLEAHLRQAVAELEASIGDKADFADAYAAEASITGWMAAFHQDDAAAMHALIGQSRRLLARAKELAPDNPRVLWVVGGVFLFAPVEHGGSVERAIEVYRRMAELADRPRRESSPLPDWGQPEALMSLAYAHLHQSPPNLESAVEEARAALRLQPDWSYVRDILLPQIEAERARR